MSALRTFFAGTEPWMAAAPVPGYGDLVELDSRAPVWLDGGL